jgi:hypothetical protein
VTMGSRCSSAFDLIELNGDDLRREPLEWRKAALERLLARAESGVQLNEHLEAEGPLVFEHACRMGLEGIVSKRKGSWYSSGRSRDWLKAKNPKAPAVTRLAEEDWGRSWSSSAGRRPSPRRRWGTYAPTAAATCSSPVTSAPIIPQRVHTILGAESAHGRLVWQPVSIERRAMMATPRAGGRTGDRM